MRKIKEVLKRKRGTAIVPESVIWLSITLIVVGAGLILIGAKFGYFGDLGKLIITGEKEPKEILGDELVGIDLGDAFLSLKYYTGSSWKLIEDERYMRNNKEIVRKDVRDELEKFYFNTKRKPENPKWDAPNFKEWTITDPALAVYLYIKENTRPEYVGFDEPKFYSISFIDNRIREGVAGNKSITSPIFLDEYEGVINEAIEWRDQILEGREFELFVELQVNETGEYEPRKYTVRRVDQYVFVDLNKLASGEEKYYTQGVGGVKKDQNTILINNAEIMISFDFKKGVKGVFWGIPPGPIGGVKGWYVINEFGSYLPAVALGANEFRMSSEERLDFYLGLQSIADDLDRYLTPNDYNNIIIKIIGGDGREAIIYQTEDGGEQGGMIESVVNAYNAQFEEVSEEDL